MKKILVNSEGYNQFFELLKKLREYHTSNIINGSEAFKDAVGDGWHDNFAFEEAMRQERDIAARIEKMIKEEKDLKLINKEETSSDIINFDDTVKLKFIYFDGEEEIELIKLTGKYMPDTNAIVKEISLNSPLGKSLYLKKVGTKFNYEVNDKVIEVEILEKNK
jgi:transcription elongation GreA/GreB family factor